MKKKIMICSGVIVGVIAIILAITPDKKDKVIVKKTPYIFMEDDENFIDEVREDDRFLSELEYRHRYGNEETIIEESNSEERDIGYPRMLNDSN